MSIPAPDEISMEDPLCDSSLGSMVTLDYVTPLTLAAARTNMLAIRQARGRNWQAPSVELPLLLTLPLQGLSVDQTLLLLLQLGLNLCKEPLALG